MAARAEIIVFDHFPYVGRVHHGKMPFHRLRLSMKRRLPVVYLYVPSCPENLTIQICQVTSRWFWDGHLRALVEVEAWDLDEYLNDGMNELLLRGHILVLT